MPQTINNMTATWNSGGTTFTGIKFNVTDTASAAGSLLMDLQVGGASRFSINKSGNSIIPRNNAYAFALSGAYSVGFYNRADYAADISMDTSVGGAPSAYLGFRFELTGPTLSWGLGTRDIVLTRDAANTLAQRNSTNAQIFRVYNTFTDASNYERGKFAFESNVLVIGTEKGSGGGTQRDLRLDVSGGTAVGISLKSDTSGYFDHVYSSTIAQRFTTSGVYLQSTQRLFWSPTTVTTSIDLGLGRSAAGILALTDGSTGGATMEFTEQTAPAAPAANGVRIYAVDNGSGKTQLMALFATGAAQQIAIQP